MAEIALERHVGLEVRSGGDGGGGMGRDMEGKR